MVTDNFASKPIIIIGAGLSGTRLMVEILSVLGSDPGDIGNIWREEELFLSIHKELVHKMTDGRDWTESIFDIGLVNTFVDNLQYVDYVRSRLDAELDSHFPARAERPWHWKCPPVYFFMNTWLEIFPEAYFVYVHRDPRMTALSQMTRQQFFNPYGCLSFLDAVRKRLDGYRPRMQHCLDIDFERLPEQMQQLADFLPMECSPESVQKARGLFRPKQRGLWEFQDSWRKNAWLLFCKASLWTIYKLGLAGHRRG